MKNKKEDNIIQQKISGNFKRTIVHLDNIMVVVCDYSHGPMDKPQQPHSHPHEQITYLAEGELFFYKDGKEFHLNKGDMITIPPDVQHCIRTLSPDVRLIDSFCPIRKDFLL